MQQLDDGKVNSLNTMSWVCVAFVLRVLIVLYVLYVLGVMLVFPIHYEQGSTYFKISIQADNARFESIVNVQTNCIKLYDLNPNLKNVKWS